jgi:hypothetical protein
MGVLTRTHARTHARAHARARTYTRVRTGTCLTGTRGGKLLGILTVP